MQRYLLASIFYLIIGFLFHVITCLLEEDEKYEERRHCVHEVRNRSLWSSVRRPPDRKPREPALLPPTSRTESRSHYMYMYTYILLLLFSSELNYINHHSIYYIADSQNAEFSSIHLTLLLFLPLNVY